MRRRHDTTPFDYDADEAADVTQEFWGASRDWGLPASSHQQRAASAPIDDDVWGSDHTGPIAAIRDGLTAFRPQRRRRRDDSGSIARTREHGVVRASPDHTTAPTREAREPREATLGELASGAFGVDDVESYPSFEHDLATQRHDVSRGFATVSHDDDWFDDAVDVPLTPATPATPLARRLGAGAVDPLLLRLGALIVGTVLLLPVILALREGDAVTDDGAAAPISSVSAGDTGTAGAPPAGAPPTAAPAAATGQQETAPASSSVDATGAVGDVVDVVESTEPAATIGATIATTAATEATASAVQDLIVEPATVSEEAERVEPACPQTYEAAPGDSWYRIADAAGISPADLLAENRATVDTVILPGDTICLPAGAKVPAPPATTPATTVPAPKSTSTVPATTVPAPPATTVPPRASTAEVQQMIRDVFPDDIEERALEIAYRESKYRSNAHNGTCCYGVFQIHWTAHRGWLDDYGVTSANQLLDARKNIELAYVMYQRAGGWGPWGG